MEALKRPLEEAQPVVLTFADVYDSHKMSRNVLVMSWDKISPGYFKIKQSVNLVFADPRIAALYYIARPTVSVDIRVSDDEGDVTLETIELDTSKYECTVGTEITVAPNAFEWVPPPGSDWEQWPQCEEWELLIQRVK